MEGFSLAYFGAAIGLGLIVIGAGLGIGRLAAAAAEGIARQPSATDKITGAVNLPLFLLEGVAGDVAAATGDAFLGLRAIGDTDPRMATRYVQNRDDRMVAAFAKLDREQEPKAQPNRNADNDEGATPEGTAPATPDREGQAS